MARENQGLQIALIVFVMLTIILGATTYIFFRQNEESQVQLKKANDESGKNRTASDANRKEADELRDQIGLPKGANHVTAHADDMKKFAGGQSDELRKYHPLLEKMAKTLEERDAEIVKLKNDLQELNTKFTTREASKKPQLDAFDARAKKAETELKAASDKFLAETTRVRSDQTKLQTELETTRKESNAEIGKANNKYEIVRQQNQRLATQFKQKSEEYDKIRSATFDAPEGEVRWVNQRNGVVWINLGKEDGLPTQMSFAVYPADLTNLNTSERKASIEVTQILGDHLAEARITNDRPEDPIMPGDKINTPLWNPGEVRHFALNGFIDVDGDGESDLAMVRDLITMNGGVVDCYLDEKGHVVGKMTINTRYLVTGVTPDEKESDRTVRDGFSKIEREQEQLSTRRISLQELLNQMGWKKPASVVHYGRDAKSADFQPKAEPGKQKTAPGNVFTPRKPPMTVPFSAH